MYFRIVSCIFVFLLCVGQVVSEELKTGDFSCRGRPAGYYADVASDCEKYHVCGGGKLQYTYSCPNTTRFQQRMMICDHWYLVDCQLSEKDFDANLLIGQRDVPFVSAAEFSATGHFHDNSKNVRTFTAALLRPVSPSSDIKYTPPPQIYVKNTQNLQTTQNFRSRDTINATLQNFSTNSNSLANNSNPPQQKSNNLYNQFTTQRPLFRTPFPSTRRTTFFTTRSPKNYATTQRSFFSDNVYATSTVPSFPSLITTSLPRRNIYSAVPYVTSNSLDDGGGNISPRFSNLARNPKSEEVYGQANILDQRRQVQPHVKLEWTLPDTRAMLFIPDDPVDAVEPNIKRYSLIIPKPEMTFRNSTKLNNGQCPDNCHPLLMSPATCKPCFLIK